MTSAALYIHNEVCSPVLLKQKLDMFSAKLDRSWKWVTNKCIQLMLKKHLAAMVNISACQILVPSLQSSKQQRAPVQKNSLSVGHVHRSTLQSVFCRAEGDNQANKDAHNAKAESGIGQRALLRELKIVSLQRLLKASLISQEQTAKLLKMTSLNLHLAFHRIFLFSLFW